MMTAELEISAEARRRIEDYLRMVRASLVGCRSVDAAEVERDVREHIETALHDVPSPVGEADVEQVLRRLGSPYQWVPVEELTWWRRAMLKFRTSTDDRRLIYLSFGLLVAGLCIPVFLPGLLIASVLVARAALSLGGGPEGVRGYRWLLYPQLLLLYVPPTALLLVWPMIAVCAYVQEERRNITMLSAMPWEVMTFHAVVIGCAAVAAWWVVVAMLAFIARRAVRAVYYPFAERWRWREAALLLVCAGLLAVPILVDGRAREMGRAIWEQRFPPVDQEGNIVFPFDKS